MTQFINLSTILWSIAGSAAFIVLAEYFTRLRGILVLPRERRCAAGLLSEDIAQRSRGLDDFMSLGPHLRERVLAHLFIQGLSDTTGGYRALHALGEVLGRLPELAWIHELVRMLNDESRDVKQRSAVARALSHVDDIEASTCLNAILMAKTSDRALLGTVQHSMIRLGVRGLRHFIRALHSRDPYRVRLAAEGVAQLTELMERENLTPSAILSLRDAAQRLESSKATDSETTITLNALHRALQAIGVESRPSSLVTPIAAVPQTA